MPRHEATELEGTGVAGAALPSERFVASALVGGKYRVERVLAEGGLGVVVLAKHVQLDQLFAIKYLQPKALANPTVVERFTREARLAAMIRSDHAIRVHDVAETPDGQPYIVMEYLDGRDLADTLEQSGPLPVTLAVDYVIQACDALGEAHAMGIVHRDLKPGNIFIAKRAGGSSLAKVLDFGISKLSERMIASGAMKKITTDTDHFGTPSYMSPEQLSGAANADVRSDVWALGVVLFELLTNQMPFVGETMLELVIAIGTKPHARLEALLSDVPPDLGAVIDKCLAKDAAQRYRNVAELVQDLLPFASPAGRLTAEHVVAVVREGGASVRPPSRPESVGMVAVPPPSTLPSFEVPASVRTSGVTGGRREPTSTSWEEMQRPRSNTRAMLVAGGAALVVIAVGVAGFTLRGKASSKVEQGAASGLVVAAPSPSPSAAFPAVPPPATPSATLAPAVSAAEAPKGAAPKAPKATAAPARTAAPESGGARRKQFGDRQ